MQFNSICVQKTDPKSGFGIMEVLIAMALLFMLSLGMTSLFTNMQNEQKRQSLIAFLTSNKNLFENAFKNDQSWANILTGNAVMADCILDAPAVCDVSLSVTPPAANTVDMTFANTIQVYNGATSPGSVVYDGRIQNAAGPFAGFTEKGSPCNPNAFDPRPNQGNDACPIGYVVTIIPHAAVTNPKVTVFAKMIFNGASTNPLNTFFNATITNTTFNPKYDVKIERTAASVNKSFAAESVRTLTGGGCLNGGFGDCASTGTRYLNWREPAGEDQFGLITVDNNGVTITEAGKYSCNVTTFAFRAGSVESRLTNDTWAGTKYGGANGFASAPTAGYTTLQFQTNLTVLTVPFTLAVWQSCSAGGTLTVPDATVNSCQLGFGNAYTGDAVRARVNCIKLSD